MTKDELEMLNKANLVKLSNYLGVKIDESWSRKQVIQAILDADPPIPDNPPSPDMSVRVKRILYSSKGNK